MQIADWLMVFDYGCLHRGYNFICRANIRSAMRQREQIAESVRQFNEENRAFVTVNFEIVRGGLAVLHIQNHGKHVPLNVRIKLHKRLLITSLTMVRTFFEKLRDATFTLRITCKVGIYLSAVIYSCGS